MEISLILGVTLFLIVMIPFLYVLATQKSNFFCEKTWYSNTFAVIFLVSGIMMLIGSTAWKNNAIINSPFFLLFDLVVILFSIFMFVFPKQMSKKRIKEQAQKAAEASLAEKNKKISIDIFSKCFEKGIYALNSDEDVNGLMIISGMYGITDIEQAKAMFTKGQLLSQKQKAAENKKILKSARENEAKNHKEEKEKAKISAKEKYLWGTKAIQASCALTAALSTSGMAGASEAMRYRAQKSDSAILGGIANGLAGPGAGIATAINTEIENARAEAEAAEVRANAREAYKHHQEALRDTQRKQYTVDKRIKFIEGLVCDEQNIT